MACPPNKQKSATATVVRLERSIAFTASAIVVLVPLPNPNNCPSKIGKIKPTDVESTRKIQPILYCTRYGLKYENMPLAFL